MVFGCISTLALVATAIAAGLGYFSFWWILIPAFFSGSFSLSNGPHYNQIIEANRQGRLGFFPVMLILSVGFSVAAAGAVYWLTGVLSD